MLLGSVTKSLQPPGLDCQCFATLLRIHDSLTRHASANFVLWRGRSLPPNTWQAQNPSTEIAKYSAIGLFNRFDLAPSSCTWKTLAFLVADGAPRVTYRQTNC